jgi:hypothetical protein
MGPGLGLGVIDQAVPFHDSTSVELVDEVSSVPTATQLMALLHDTL